MENRQPGNLGRRDFLYRALLAGGSASLGANLAGGAVAPGAAEAATEPPPASIYLALGPDEAAFVEALVNLLCPADELTPNGVDCGLAAFIDRQLAGGFGKGERMYRRGPWRQGPPELGYQLPLTPEEFFKAGLAAADAACRQHHGRSFADLDATAGNEFLTMLADGRGGDARVPLAEWFNELVYPLFIQACFADPVYGGNRDKVFWKMIGYPGLPAVNALNMVKFRGQPFPGAQAPQSMADFG